MAEELPESQKQGLDKRVLIAAAAIVVAIAVFLLFFNPIPSTQAASFTVSVIGQEGQNVVGATVEVYDGVELLVSSATNAQGKADLPELPRKLLAIKVTTPDGSKTTRLVDLTRTKSLKIDLSQASEESTESEATTIPVQVIDSETKKGIGNAKIVYTIDRISKTATADGTGRAQLNSPKSAALRLRASAAGYYAQSLTVVANPPLPAIKLRSKAASESIQFSPSEREQTLNGRVVVMAEDQQTTEGIEQGTACIFSAETAQQLGCASLIEGTAEITGLEQGLMVYVVVNASGYYEYSSAMNFQPQEITDLTIINARMRLIPASDYADGILLYTLIRTVDENNAPVPATIHVIPYPSLVPLPSKQSPGELRLELSDESTFYAIAYAPGRVPAATTEFTAGTTQTLVLETASQQNSASLEVIAVDEDERALNDASVTVLVDGLLLLPPQQTVSHSLETTEDGFDIPTKPSAVFPALALGMNYELRGKYQKGIGKAFLTLTDDALVNLPLLVNTGFIELYATDLVSGTSISNARFQLNSENLPSYACTGSGCTFFARANTASSIEVTALGYLSTTRPLNSRDVTIGGTKTITVSLLPAGTLNATLVQFTGLSDERGDSVYDVVRFNQTYFANFVIASANAVHTGLSVRTGTASEVKNDKTGIIDFAPPQKFGLAKSTSYTPSSSCENDLRNSNPEDGLLKWVDVSFDGAGTANIAIPIQVKPNARNNDNFTIYYRGYSFVQTPNGNRFYSRTPFDSILAFNESTAAKASCYAETNRTTFQIIVPAPGAVTPQEREPPLPASQFTISDTIILEETGLRSVHNLTEYVLQIDPIMPADAMPIALKPRVGGCIILVSPIKINSSTSKCYRYDSTFNSIIFESKESNPLCPIQVNGNKLYNAGREFKGEKIAEITYKVGGCDLSAELTLPISVTAVEADAIYAAPEGNELGDGDAAKPLYVVNQKQLGSRDVSLEYSSQANTSASSPQTKTIPMYSGSAYAIAFRGPGTLSIYDGQETINEIQYQDPLQVIRTGLGTTGFRKTSCSDYKCCSHGWCTKKAAKQAITNFKEKAMQIASKTAFRRGNNQPLKTIASTNNYSFATVLQVIQDADAILAENNFTKDPREYERGNCENGTPAVFELRATGDNADNLSYSARVLPLYKFAYTDTSCQTGFTRVDDSSTGYAGLDYLPLCGFLYGNDSCVTRAPESNAMTLDQTSKLKLDVTICMYPSFEVVSMPLCLPGCGIGWVVYYACKSAAYAECYASNQVDGIPNLPAIEACQQEQCRDKKPDNDGSQWTSGNGYLHKILGSTLLPNVAVFSIKQEIPYDESTTKDAFEKIGKAFSNIDFRKMDYESGMKKCFAINTGLSWQASNLVNNIGGEHGLNYQNWLNSLLPVIVGHGCACKSSDMWKGLPAYSSGSGSSSSSVASSSGSSQGSGQAGQTGSQGTQQGSASTGGASTGGGGTSSHPACYGAGDIVAALVKHGTPPNGVPWSFSFGTRGNNVFLRMDVGVAGNCKIANPFSREQWGGSTSAILANLGKPILTSLVTYLATGRDDFAISISTSPQMGTNGEAHDEEEAERRQREAIEGEDDADVQAGFESTAEERQAAVTRVEETVDDAIGAEAGNEQLPEERDALEEAGRQRAVRTTIAAVDNVLGPAPTEDADDQDLLQ